MSESTTVSLLPRAYYLTATSAFPLSPCPLSKFLFFSLLYMRVHQ